MKSFVQIREATKKGMPPGEHVYDAKVGKHKIMVHKEKNKFVAYIDMEKLDTFNSLNDAKKAAEQFIKMAGDK
jgi:translation elongation factor EF-G